MISVRYGAPLQPIEGETHQELSKRMAQAIAELHDEDSSSWWESMQRAEQKQTPSLAGPRGPGWLRSWEGSGPVPRRGPKKTWR